MIGPLVGLLTTALAQGSDLGPVDQNPDDAFRRACELTGTCDRGPRPTAPPRKPSGGGGEGGGSFASLFSLLVWGLILVAVAAVLFVIVRAVMQRTGKDVSVDDSTVATPTTARPRTIDRTREPDVWRDEAERLRAEGRFREAMRCRYRGLVGDLARGGLLDEIPGRTTGEERRQFAEDATPGQAQFEDATFLFDAAWYGNRPVGPTEYSEFIELEGDVLAATGAGRRNAR